MSKALELINKHASQQPSGWLEDANWREENRDWLKKSFQIAVKILREIRRQKPINGMTQKKLADAIGVTPQYINKVVKGQENLTLSTISKIEAVLGIALIEIPTNTITQPIEKAVGIYSIMSSFSAQTIGSIKLSLNAEEKCPSESCEYLANGTYGY